VLFKNVIGQQAVKDQLVQMVAHNRLSHALLFLGKEGSGALPLALAFANYIAMPATTASAAPAGPSLFGDAEPASAPAALPETAVQADLWMQQHPSFSKAHGMVHPDIHYAYPVIPKKSGDKPVSADYITEWRRFVNENPYGNAFDWLQFIGAENKQGNITAHECTEILRTMSLKSFESGYKILVMWMPEFLGKEGNKLLKVIEEPPPDTLFILVAENEEQILPTILSRTQLVKVPALETADIETALLPHTDAAKARQVAAICNGNYHEALHLLQHTDDNWLHLLRECLNAALKTGPVAMVKWTDQAAALGREKQKQFLRYCIHLLHQSIRAMAIGPQFAQLPEAEKDFALRLAKLAGLEQQQALAGLFNDYIYYIERNANAKMLFHALMIQIYHIIANKSVLLMKQ
jgi:DNA polymerase III subunit delta'